MSSPTCHPPVPALSTSINRLRSLRRARSRRTTSAVGERQMFPEQTKQIRTGARSSTGPVWQYLQHVAVVDPTFLAMPLRGLAGAALTRAEELGADYADFRL